MKLYGFGAEAQSGLPKEKMIQLKIPSAVYLTSIQLFKTEEERDSGLERRYMRDLKRMGNPSELSYVVWCELSHFIKFEIDVEEEEDGGEDR